MPIFIQNGAKFEILELWLMLWWNALNFWHGTRNKLNFTYTYEVLLWFTLILALLFTIDFSNKIASGVYLHRQKITKTNIYLKKFYCRQRSKLQIVPKIIRSFSYPNRHSVCLPNSTLCMEDDDDYGKVRFLCPRRAPAVTFASNSILFERCCIELVQSMSAGWAWAPDKKLPECDKGPPPPTTFSNRRTASHRFGFLLEGNIYFFLSLVGHFRWQFSSSTQSSLNLGHIFTQQFSVSVCLFY